MQPYKSKLALIMGTLFLTVSSSSYAVDKPFDISIDTRDDVSLAQVQSLDFGTNMFTTAGASCVMSAINPTGADVQANNAALTGLNFGELSGAGCAAGTIATPGIYKVTADAGVNITVTISPSDTPNPAFGFLPNSGCIIDFDGASLGDTCKVLVASNPTTVMTANATDDGDPEVKAGETLLAVGGTILIGGAALTPETDYTDTFKVEVTY